MSVNGDLDADIRIVALRRLDRESSLLVIADTALTIVLGGTPLGTFLLAEGDSVGGRGGLSAEGEDGVGGFATVSGEDVSGSAGTRGVGSGGDGEGTTVDESSTDGEDDTEGHGGSEDGGHARKGRKRILATRNKGRGTDGERVIKKVVGPRGIIVPVRG